MSFYHVVLKGNPPLVASYCPACRSCVAVSSHEELLLESERKHRCSESPGSDDEIEFQLRRQPA